LGYPYCAILLETKTQNNQKPKEHQHSITKFELSSSLFLPSSLQDHSSLLVSSSLPVLVSSLVLSSVLVGFSL
jgi:hypothetical protein